MRSDIDTIKKALSESQGLTEETTLNLMKRYFRFVKNNLQQPTKPEITIGYVGRFKVSLPKLNSHLTKLQQRVDGQDKYQDHELRLQRTKQKIQSLGPLVDIFKELKQKGKTQKSHKRNKRNESKDQS